jgi:hypothetical protein
MPNLNKIQKFAIAEKLITTFRVSLVGLFAMNKLSDYFGAFLRPGKMLNF